MVNCVVLEWNHGKNIQCKLVEAFIELLRNVVLPFHGLVDDGIKNLCRSFCEPETIFLVRLCTLRRILHMHECEVEFGRDAHFNGVDYRYNDGNTCNQSRHRR